MHRETTIYAACDPLTQEVRYVGKTVKTVEQRIYDHLNNKLTYRSANWFKKVKTPAYFVLEMVPPGGD